MFASRINLFLKPTLNQSIINRILDFFAEGVWVADSKGFVVISVVAVGREDGFLVFGITELAHDSVFPERLVVFLVPVFEQSFDFLVAPAAFF